MMKHRRAYWLVLTVSLTLLLVTARGSKAQQDNVRVVSTARNYSNLDILYTTTRMPTNEFITPEQAVRIAVGHVTKMVETGVTEEWEGATVSEPVEHYDLDGNVSAYVFSVFKAGNDVGYIVVSSEPSERPVVEFSTSQARHKIGAGYSERVVGEQGLFINKAMPLYFGALSYYYEVFDDETYKLTNTRRIIEMGSNTVITSSGPIQNSMPTGIGQTINDITSTSVFSEIISLQPDSYGYVNGVPSNYDRNWTSGGCKLGCDSASAGAVLKYWADLGYSNLVPVDELTMLWSVRSYLNVNCDGFAGHPPYTSEAVVNYANDQGYSDFSTSRTNCYINNWACYNIFVNEIDNQRPSILLFFPWPSTGVNHAVVGVGYSDNYMIVYDNAWGVGGDTNVLYNANYTYMRVETVVAYQPDTTPPTKASNVQPNGWTGPYTNDTTPSFRWNSASDSGSGIAGYYVAVDDWTPEGSSGNDWWAGNVTAFTVPDAQSDGEHIFAVTSKDNAGNVNPTNTNHQGDAPYYTFYVDTTAPTNPTSVTSGCGAQDGVWQRDCIDPTFTWSGASDHGGAGIKDYHIYWGIDSNGVPDVWHSAVSYNPGMIDTSSGIVTYYLRISTRDNLGHESEPETVFTLRYDGSVPTANPLVASGAETVHSLQVDIEPRAQDTGSGLNTTYLSGDSATWYSEPYAASTAWVLEPLSRRFQMVYLEVEDIAGNRSPRYSCLVCLDLYPPHPSSEGYQLWNAGPIASGNRAISPNYRLHNTAGQSMMGGDLSSTNYRLHSGFQALWPANPDSEMFTPFSCQFWIYLPVILRGN